MALALPSSVPELPIVLFVCNVRCHTTLPTFVNRDALCDDEGKRKKSAEKTLV